MYLISDKGHQKAMATCCDPQLGDFLIELEQETWDNLIAGNGEWNEKR